MDQYLLRYANTRNVPITQRRENCVEDMTMVSRERKEIQRQSVMEQIMAIPFRAINHLLPLMCRLGTDSGMDDIGTMMLARVTESNLM